MSINRRSFVAAAAMPQVQLEAQPKPDHRLDPLGLRADFPIVSDHIFLNSAYIAPAPRAVVAASHAHIHGKSSRPMQPEYSDGRQRSGSSAIRTGCACHSRRSRPFSIQRESVRTSSA
jgi:hypothetical protein